MIRYNINKKIIIGLLVFSGLATIVVSAIQLYSQYTFDVGQLEGRIDQIFNVHSAPLAEAVWVSHGRLIQSQLDGIAQLPGISAVSLKFDDVRFKTGTTAVDDQQITTRPIDYIYRGKPINVAELTVYSDHQGIISRLKKQVSVLLVTQAIKTLLVTGFVFLLVYWLLVRHLNDMAKQLKYSSVNNLKPVTLNRKPHEKESFDELDVVVESFNELQDKLKEAFKDLTYQNILLDEKVKERTLELQKALIFKSRFLANMSHELRTPLNAILGFSQRLMHYEGKALGNREIKALESINSNGSHLLSLVNDILSMAQIDAGKLNLVYEPIDINGFFEEAFANIAPLAEQKKLTFEMNISDDGCVFYTDRRSLVQIFNNLCSNAIKFTSQGSVFVSVSLRCGLEAQTLKIEIQDTGMGIKNEDQEKLFQEFSRLSHKNSDVIEGTGLGLVITAGLVKALGGWIRCHSEQGKGTTFTVEIPSHSGAS